jgi:hypothetical protein
MLFDINRPKELTKKNGICSFGKLQKTPINSQHTEVTVCIGRRANRMGGLGVPYTQFSLFTTPCNMREHKYFLK